MKNLFLGVLLSWSCNILSLNAQDLFDKMRNVPILTPQAAAFAKYVEFPTGLYNGIPSISVPLYTITSGDITIPISLSYHAGGIKVAEEASWVGLGWNLQVGGVISRQINGKDDYLNPTSNYFGVIFPGGAYNYDENYANKTNFNVCNAYDATGNGILSKYPGELLYNITLSCDGEPDTYMYNFGNYSGKFINTVWNGNGNGILDFGNNNIQFIVTPNEIIAKTPDGYTYDFSYLEKGLVGPDPAILSYYLTSITSATGKQVTFEYETELRVRQMPTKSEQFSGSYGSSTSRPPYLNDPKGYTSSDPVYLKKINFDNGYIDFIRGDRNDMYGKKLDRIEIYNNDQSLFKTFRFSQSYFNGNTPSRHYLEPTIPPDSYQYPESYLMNRLKLNAVSEEVSGSSPITHQFQYYEGANYTLPYKSSWAVDYWGYYNGKTANVGFIPSNAGFNSGSIWPTIQNYKGSNREADESYAKAFMLKQIIYPTGGWTAYEYSIHQFTNAMEGPLSERWVSLTQDPAVDIGTGTNEKTFTLNGVTDVNLLITLYCDCQSNACYGNDLSSKWTCQGVRNTAYGPNALYAELRKLNPSTNKFEFMGWDYTWDIEDILAVGNNATGYFNETKSLQPGTYKMVVNYPDDHVGVLGSKMAEMLAQTHEYYHEMDPKGGGLRCSKITHHDPFNNVDLTKTYSYTNGLLMHGPRFYWSKQYFENVQDGQNLLTANILYEYLYSNSVTPYSTSANGNAVGYSNVTETLSGGTAGKTEYVYENLPDNFNQNSIDKGVWPTPLLNVSAFAPGIPSTPHLKNGFLKEVYTYDQTNNLVKKTINTPQVVNPGTYWSFKGDKQTNIGTDAPQTPCNTPGGTFFMYYFYPLQMGKVVSNESVDFEYVNGVPTYKTVHDYEYNSQSLLVKEKITNSDGKINSTEIKYAKDYSSGTSWINDLLQKNMIAIPLETMKKVDGNVVDGSFVQYKTAGGLTTPNQVFKTEISAPKVIASTAPSATLPGDFKLDGTIEYDTNGNIVSVQAANNITTIYIWGYNHNYLVAKIENATLNEVKAVLGNPIPDLGEGGLLPQQITDLRSSPSLTKALITTYAYVPLKGMISQTDPNGVMTYYEYDSFGRLKLIKDKDHMIVKQYEYHYQGQ